MSIKIRPYNVSDVFALAKMISSLIGSAGNDLRSLFSGESAPEEEDQRTDEEKEKEAEEQGIAIIMLVMHKCYSGAEPLLMDWFASLCEVSTADFLRMPPETALEVIEQIAERKESKDFFSKAYQLFKKFGGIGMLGNGA